MRSGSFDLRPASRSKPWLSFLKTACSKKSVLGDGECYKRNPANEKLEIDLVEQSTVSAGRTLALAGISRHPHMADIAATWTAGWMPWGTSSLCTAGPDKTPTGDCTAIVDVALDGPSCRRRAGRQL